MATTAAATASNAMRLLLVDDDETFCGVLKRSFEKRGLAVTVAQTVEAAIDAAKTGAFDYAVVDLRIPDGSGLTVVEQLRRLCQEARVVVLTGYASIATAVEAIKLGAVHYLTKPVDVDEIFAAFQRDKGDAATQIATRPLSVNRLEWEHMQKVLLECEGNISLAARRLSMHRRTLQRKLKKNPVKA